MNKILIVDDDKDIRDSLSVILENNYIIATAGNAKEARIELSNSVQPEVILLDVKMESEHEGFELVSEINRKFKQKRIPVILITSLEVKTVSAAVSEIVREMRIKYPEQNLNILVLRSVTGEVMIDYLSNETGQSVCIKVDGFHPKPIEPARLIHDIELILAKSRLENKKE